MTRSKGKLVALAVAVVGISTLGVAGFAFRGRIVEEYYIWRVKSKDPAAVALAAKKLGEMRSVRAVPALLEICTRTDLSDEARTELLNTILPVHEQVVLADIPSFVIEAIGKMGRSALPALSKTFKGRSWESHCTPLSHGNQQGRWLPWQCRGAPAPSGEGLHPGVDPSPSRL